MVFVDTGAWFALSVASDRDHARATSFIAANRRRLDTTDYIVDELLTLFIGRGYRGRAIDWIEDVLHRGSCDLIQVETQDFQAACALFVRFSDKRWSFTDCTSFVVMQRLGIRYAFAFDDHFRQFGSVVVHPKPGS